MLTNISSNTHHVESMNSFIKRSKSNTKYFIINIFRYFIILSIIMSISIICLISIIGFFVSFLSSTSLIVFLYKYYDVNFKTSIDAKIFIVFIIYVSMIFIHIFSFFLLSCFIVSLLFLLSFILVVLIFVILLLILLFNIIKKYIFDMCNK